MSSVSLFPLPPAIVKWHESVSESGMPGGASATGRCRETYSNTLYKGARMTGFSPRPEGGACSQSRRWLLALLVGVAVLTGNSLPHKDHLMAADLEGRVR